MTGAALAETLVARGLDSAELGAKQSLFDLVVRRLAALDPVHNSDADRQAVHAWWVPGRLEVFGTHTDYAGGHTLVSAVPRGFALVMRPRADNVVRVIDALRGQDMSLVANDLRRASSQSDTGWRRYVTAVCRRLGRNFPGAKLGADIVLASDLPRASGMSSSSALVVGVSAALACSARLRERDEWQRNIRTIHDEAGYYACMENGLSFGSLEGDSGVGTHGGSEDHAAILTATGGHVSAFTFVPVRALDVAPVPAVWRFVLSPSGIPAQKAGTARDAYNRLSEGTRVLLTLWNEDSADPAPSLRAALITSERDSLDADRVQQLFGLVRRSSIAGWSHEALERRLDHFVREDARTAEAVEAFRGGDERRLGQLAADSQAEAETLLGNQIPETIELAARAKMGGAFAARSFGAGFGGSVWALVHADRAKEFAQRWSPHAFVAMPGPPLTELSD